MIEQHIKDFLISLNSHCLLQPPKAIVEIRHNTTSLVHAGDPMQEGSRTIFKSDSLLVHIAGVFENSTPVCLITEQCDAIGKSSLRQICADHEEYLFCRCKDIDGPFEESWWLVLRSANMEDIRKCSMRIVLANYTERDEEETVMLICDTASIQLRD